MKIFSWVQGKFNVRQGTKKSNTMSAHVDHKPQEPRKEEFSDWPHGFLAIGTFGNNDPKQVPETTLDHLQGNTFSPQDQPQDLTPDEVEKLHNEFKLLLHNQDGYCTSTADQLELTRNLLSDELFDCPSRLEGDRMNHDAFADNSMNEKDGYLQQSTSMVRSRRNDVCLDNTQSAINKRSFSLLLKKMFVCTGGFALKTPLRDPLPESRMEKILRAMLHKKIYPQSSSSPTLSKKKYLKNKRMTKSESEDEMNEKESDGSKWVKTDSEYIVLEI